MLLPHQGQAVQIDASHWASRPATHHTSGRQVAGTMKWRCAQSSSHYQGKPTGSETFCVHLTLNWVHHVISSLFLCRPVTVDFDSDPTLLHTAFTPPTLCTCTPHPSAAPAPHPSTLHALSLAASRLQDGAPAITPALSVDVHSKTPPTCFQFSQLCFGLFFVALNRLAGDNA